MQRTVVVIHNQCALARCARTDSPTSGLNNLKVKVIDANLEPIKFLNPVYVMEIVQGISDDENAEKDEPFGEAESNADIKNMIRQTLSKYHNTKQFNDQKVEAGVAVEPQHGAFPQKEENKPEELVLVQKLTVEQTQD